jgi:hypothetical protein
MTFAMATHQRGLMQVFSDDYEFEIPSYQRPYEWGTPQAEKLLEDIAKGIASDTGSFLGALVVVKASDGDPKASVIDGQQRLTTLTILFSVLRDLTTDPVLRRNREKYIAQAADLDAGRDEKPRLLLRISDRIFFRQRVQTPGGTLLLDEATPVENGSQAKILDVAMTFKRRLSAMTEERRNAFFSFMLRKGFLVVISVPDRKSARLIFTVLNSRGVDLSAVDVLKAAFLDGCPDEAGDVYAHRWEDIEDRIGRGEFERLFHLILSASKHDDAHHHDDMEETFPHLVPAFRRHEEFLADTLSPAATFLSLGKRGNDARMRLGSAGAMHLRSLVRLRRIDRDWEFVALSRFLSVPDNEWNLQAPFLSKLERLAYFMAVTGVSPSDKLVRYKAARDAVLRGDDIADLSELEKAEFIKALHQPVYGRDFCLPVMQKLEDVTSTIGVEGFNDPQTIEHVLPRNPKENSLWMKAFPDRIQRPIQANMLGNLVFLTREANSRASNADFEEKKLEYVNDDNGVQNYALTMDLFTNPTWNVATLRKRQERVVGKLAQSWGLVSAPPVVEEKPTYHLTQDHVVLARAYEKNGQFVVVRGSTCLGKGNKNASKLRGDLIASGTLAPDAEGATLSFRDPWLFKTPMAAATVVLNKASKGRAAWREIGTDLAYDEAIAARKTVICDENSERKNVAA